MQPSPTVRTFFDEDTFTATHVVSDPSTGASAVIDSVLDYDPASGRTSTRSADAVLNYIGQNGFHVEWILETHIHADHLTAAAYLKQETGGKTGIGDKVSVIQQQFATLFNAGDEFARDGGLFDRLFSDGEQFQLGELDIRVIHTPGHTPACIAYVIGDAAFAGDTLFMPDYGSARCDFPGGDARALYHSIQKLFSLPDETRLFLCHDYKAPGRDSFIWETTITEQRAANVHIRDGVSEDEFVAMREGRDKNLSMPKLILPAVQVNMRAGAFPPVESNGISYLKIPLNAV